jgi:hypothetical protein
MKTLLYYLFLLVAIALITGFVISANGGSMSMPQMLGVSAALVLYTIAMSFVGEGKIIDEREQAHRYVANRSALIAGTVIASIGLIFQMFIIHHLDYWLLIALITINLTKIVSLIWLNYKR